MGNQRDGLIIQNIGTGGKERRKASIDPTCGEQLVSLRRVQLIRRPLVVCAAHVHDDDKKLKPPLPPHPRLPLRAFRAQVSQHAAHARASLDQLELAPVCVAARSALPHSGRQAHGKRKYSHAFAIAELWKRAPLWLLRTPHRTTCGNDMSRAVHMLPRRCEGGDHAA